MTFITSIPYSAFRVPLSVCTGIIDKNVTAAAPQWRSGGLSTLHQSLTITFKLILALDTSKEALPNISANDDPPFLPSDFPPKISFHLHPPLSNAIFNDLFDHHRHWTSINTFRVGAAAARDVRKKVQFNKLINNKETSASTCTVTSL